VSYIWKVTSLLSHERVNEKGFNLSTRQRNTKKEAHLHLVLSSMEPRQSTERPATNSENSIFPLFPSSNVSNNLIIKKLNSSEECNQDEILIGNDKMEDESWIWKMSMKTVNGERRGSATNGREVDQLQTRRWLKMTKSKETLSRTTYSKRLWQWRSESYWMRYSRRSQSQHAKGIHLPWRPSWSSCAASSAPPR